MVFRRLVTDFLQTHLGILVDGISWLFSELVRPMSREFGAYAGSHSAEPGILGWGAWIFGLILFLGGGIASLYVLFDSLGGIYQRITGDVLTREKQLLGATGIYAAISGLYFLTAGKLPALDRADAIRAQSATLADLIVDFDTTVGIEAFTWGYLGDPQLEFAIEVALLVFGVSLLIRQFTFIDERLILKYGLSFPTVSFVGASILDVQVFPVPIPVWFTVLTGILLGLLTLFATVVNLTVWTTLVNIRKGVHRVDPPARPEREFNLVSGIVLGLCLAVFQSGFGAAIAWLSLTASFAGGLETGWHLLRGRSYQCQPDPETGEEVCDYK